MTPAPDPTRRTTGPEHADPSPPPMTAPAAASRPHEAFPTAPSTEDDSHAPCLAWSRHAADLAEALLEDIVRWPDSPTTDALLADGLLVRIMPGVLLPPDRLGSAVARVLALGCAIGDALRAEHVIAGQSAAWVHAGGPPPPRPVLLSSAHRAVIGGVRIRTIALQPGDVETLGGAPVTTPVRTALDLVREEGAESAAALGRLLRSGQIAEAPLRRAAETVLGRDRRADLERALDDAAQDACTGAAASMGRPSEVTRYTS